MSRSGWLRLRRIDSSAALRSTRASSMVRQTRITRWLPVCRVLEQTRRSSSGFAVSTGVATPLSNEFIAGGDAFEPFENMRSATIAIADADRVILDSIKMFFSAQYPASNLSTVPNRAFGLRLAR